MCQSKNYLRYFLVANAAYAVSRFISRQKLAILIGATEFAVIMMNLASFAAFIMSGLISAVWIYNSTELTPSNTVGMNMLL